MKRRMVSLFLALLKGYITVMTAVAETIVMLDRALGVKVAVAYDKAGVYGPENWAWDDRWRRSS